MQALAKKKESEHSNQERLLKQKEWARKIETLQGVGKKKPLLHALRWRVKKRQKITTKKHGKVEKLQECNQWLRKQRILQD